MANESLTATSLLDEEQTDAQEDKFLTFAVRNEEYGIDIRNVTEIIGVQKITDLPDMPSYVKGVINLRGKVIPVIDIRLRFSMEERAYDERTCIIVVDIAGMLVGVIVDSVSEVIDIEKKDIDPPPRISGSETSRFIKGMGKVGEDVKILLDVDKVMYSEKIKQVTCQLNEQQKG